MPLAQAVYFYLWKRNSHEYMDDITPFLTFTRSTYTYIILWQCVLIWQWRQQQWNYLSTARPGFALFNFKWPRFHVIKIDLAFFPSSNSKFCHLHLYCMSLPPVSPKGWSPAWCSPTWYLRINRLKMFRSTWSTHDFHSLQNLPKASMKDPRVMQSLATSWQCAQCHAGWQVDSERLPAAQVEFGA